MDIALVLISVLISGYLELLSAMLANLPISVVSTMADEGSAVGRRLKQALDEPNESRLAVSLLDVLVQILAVVGLLLMAQVNGQRLAVDVAVLATGLALIKVIATVIGERTVEHLLRLASISLAIVTTLATPMLLVHRLILALTKPRTQQEEEEEAREELEALVETAREEGALDARRPGVALRADQDDLIADDHLRGRAFAHLHTDLQAVLGLDRRESCQCRTGLRGRESRVLPGVGVHQQQRGAVCTGDGAGPSERGRRRGAEVGADHDASDGVGCAHEGKRNRGVPCSHAAGHSGTTRRVDRRDGGARPDGDQDRGLSAHGQHRGLR